MPTAYYDGVADWYDQHLSPAPAMRAAVERLVEPGPGRCLDLCCGTGFHIPTLLALGWEVTGIDVSEDQLRVARDRVGDAAELLHGDATELPFPEGSFDLVFAAFVHTDVGDFRSVVEEAVRVLRPGGPLVYLGVHPCFVGPHSRFVEGRGVPALHPGYRQTGRYTDGPGISPTGLRAKVGATHLPLGELLQTFFAAGLVLERFEEPRTDDREYPHWLALRARR